MLSQSSILRLVRAFCTRIAGHEAGVSIAGMVAAKAPWAMAISMLAMTGATPLRAQSSAKLIPQQGRIATVAGSAVAGFAGDGGPASSAQLNGPAGVAADDAGNIFIADRGNDRIRKVDASGIIGTVAGGGAGCTAQTDSVGDGCPATSAQLLSPSSVAVDGAGNLYIADTGNHRIRKVSPNGTISTIAGNGSPGYNGDGAAAAGASLNAPAGVAFAGQSAGSATGAADCTGDLYIADSGNNVVRRITPDGIIATAAGNHSDGYLGDGGSAVHAQLSAPRGVAVDSACNLYIADAGNDAVRRVTPGGTIATVAGSFAAGSGYSGDGGAATGAQLNLPSGIAIDAAGNLWIADAANNVVRRVTADTQGGTISTVAGNYAAGAGSSGDHGPSDGAQLAFPLGVAVNRAGGLWIADSRNNALRLVEFSGTQSALAIHPATVTKTTPTITWLQPAAIVYETPLSSTQLNATAAVPGTFAYAPAAGIVLAGGARPLTVTFTPTDTVNYNTATATVTLQVNPATPTLAWATPASIPYGTALSATQLSAKVTFNGVAVAGTLAYVPAAGAVLPAGTQTLAVTFTPTTAANFNVVKGSVALQVAQATPKITWTKPLGITYPAALGSTQLSATASTAGTFVYSPPAGTVLAAGIQTLSVTFTPTDKANYTGAGASTTITVSKATPAISWPQPAAIAYGTAVSSAQLNATTPVPGSFVFSPAMGAQLVGGPHVLTAIFSPTDTVDYSTAVATVTLQVNPVTPVLAWATPAAIVYGTALSATQLNAKATVNGATQGGTYAYTLAVGTVLPVGTQTLSVTFTPSTPANCNPVSGSVTLQVKQATPKITWAKPAAITYPAALGSTQLSATASAPGTFVYTPASGAVLNPGTQTLSVTFTPADTKDYTAATLGTTITVNKAVPAIAWATPAPIAYKTALSSAQLNATASVPGTLTYSPGMGVVPAGGTQTLYVTLTPTDTTRYLSARSSVTLQVNPVSPVLTWPAPSPIISGTALGSNQLNAKATYGGVAVAGIFTYTPGVGAVPAKGTQTLTATFTPAVTNSYTPANTSVTITVMDPGQAVFFSPTSFINTPLPGTPSIDPASGTMVANSIGAQAGVAHLSNASFGVALVYSHSTDKVYSVACTQLNSNTCAVGGDINFPIPKGVVLPTGSDHSTAFVYTAQDGSAYAGKELDCWIAHYDSVNDLWSCGTASLVHNLPAGWGTCAEANTPGFKCNGGFAAGFDYATGPIRPEEIAAGIIPHALVVAINNPGTGIVCPATHTDRSGTGIPEGGRFFLPASYNVDGQTWPAWVKTVAHALQNYGAYVVDYGASFEVKGFTDKNPGSIAWDSIGVPEDGFNDLNMIPWGSMKVVATQSCN